MNEVPLRLYHSPSAGSCPVNRAGLETCPYMAPAGKVVAEAHATGRESYLIQV
jgi:hypothetical protein